MSEFNLSPLNETSKQDVNIEPIKEINAALKACTFGYFHIKLLVITFFGYMAGVFVTTSTGYLLPVAECDLNMTLGKKGLLNAIPYTGMLFSSIIAGFLTGAFGRKIFLVGGFTGLFAFTLVSASSQTYEVLLIAKFFEGLLFATCFSSFVAVTSEFCSNDIRDRIVLFQTSFAVIANIVIALISWGILTNEWMFSVFGGTYVLNTWNFYLFSVSLWSLAASVMYAVCVPESPKYLVTQMKYCEAREILVKIYVENTRKPADTYPFADIWKDRMNNKVDDNTVIESKKTLRHQIVKGLHDDKPMFQKPLGRHLAILCLINFVVMCMYNVFRLWFPQLSAIVENHEAADSTDFCVMIDEYTDKLRNTINNVSDIEICIPKKSGRETYFNSIIIGCVCLIPYLITGIVVNRVGKTSLLILASIVCIAAAMGIRWANNKTATVSLFSITIAVAKLILSLTQTITVEVFGTTTRALAISFIMVSGRIGTLTGNISFPLLLKTGCEVPFFTISGLMVCVLMVSLFMPKKKEV